MSVFVLNGVFEFLMMVNWGVLVMRMELNEVGILWLLKGDFIGVIE